MSEQARISVAIMHHPRRRDLISDLVSSFGSLHPHVVEDPDPDGAPSPLRTAKRAWLTVNPDATHHLVVQDDAVLCAGFDTLLHRVVEARPNAAIALYTNWNSPENSYLVRRAAALDYPWAYLSSREWTPTIALLLPAAHARSLAQYLAGIPDEMKDDDELVTRFCTTNRLPVLTPLPHLVDHRALPSLSRHFGHYRATIFEAKPTDTTLHVDQDLDSFLANRATQPHIHAFSVDFAESHCIVRLVRPGTGEPVDHPFGWHWYDILPVAGYDRTAVLDAHEQYRQWLFSQSLPIDSHALPFRLTVEIWAACYLLGADTSPHDARDISPPTQGSQRLRLAVASWLESGLLPRDSVNQSDALRDALIEFGCAAVRVGQHHAWSQTSSRHHDKALPTAANESNRRRIHSGESQPLALSEPIMRMAHREAMAQLLLPADDLNNPGVDQFPCPAIQWEILPCMHCGANADTALTAPIPLPYPDWVPASADHESGPPVLRTLGCEQLSPRALLAVACAAQNWPPGLPLRFWTRAAWWARCGYPSLRSDTFPDFAEDLNELESWVHDVATNPAQQYAADRVLPASTRIRLSDPTAPSNSAAVAPAPLGPHCEMGALKQIYQHHVDEYLSKMITGSETASWPGEPNR